MIKQRLIHRGHAGKCCRLHPADRLERLPRIETRQQDNAAAFRHRPVQHTGVGEHMEHGQNAQDYILALERIDRVHLQGIGRQIGMRQHCPLGRARCSAGILQQREVTPGFDRNRHGIAGPEQIRPSGDVGTIRNGGDLFAAEKFQRQPLAQRQHIAQPANCQALQR